MARATGAGRRDRKAIDGRSLVRLVLVLVAVLGLGWLTIAVGVARSARPATAAVALTLAPFDARVRAAAADQMVRSVGANRSLIHQVEADARRALQRDATIVSAWRLLGIAAALRNDMDEATRNVRFGERLSRRDLPTQIWLIEDRVRRNDIPGALRHYDIALRTSVASRDLLLPILVSASSTPEVGQTLARILQANPPWWNDFVYQFARSAPAGATTVALSESLARQGDRGMLIPLVQRLAAEGDLANAMRVYVILKRDPDAARRLVRNGDFDETDPIAPFDWTLVIDGSVRGEMRVIDAQPDDTALFLRTEVGTTGDAASQLLLLRPGRYILTSASGRSADAGPARLTWRIACSGDGGRTLLTYAGVPGPGPNALRQAFEVPVGCESQAIVLGAGATDDSGASEAWIDDIAIVPA